MLPHERTHAGPKEGRLRLLRATRTQPEPIFLLHEGDPVELPDREPDLESGGDRLWRLDDDPSERFADAQLLIADGHHRYETALAFHAEDGTEASAWMMVVLVSTQEQGLTIFADAPARAVRQRRERHADRGAGRGASGRRALPRRPLRAARGRGSRRRPRRPAAPEGVTYTPERADAVAAVDRGDAEAAFLLRPTRIEDVFEVARRGEVMPQKSTYFFPKLTSGLLLYPLD